MYQNDNTVYYPQDELTTMLIPVSTGCPYNKCKFCSMYKDSIYSKVPLDDVEFELMNGYKYTEKVFLTGADPLSIGYERMMSVLKLIKKHLPYCARVASYASVRSILKYSEEELSNLHDAGLRLLYIGFETGSDEVLKLINKGSTVADSLKAAQKLNKIHLPFNSIIMYGVAGENNGLKNAQLTAQMLNQFESNKIITMNLTLFDGTELAEMADKGEYIPSGRSERLEEVRCLIENLDPAKSTIFDTTHPTNILKIYGKIPEDKDRLISEINEL